MEKEQVIAALKKYETRIRETSYFKEEQLSEEMKSVKFINFGERAALGHVLWMCVEAQKFVNEGRMEKAMRWLGFIQGALWARSYSSIEDLKVDNMPPGATYDATRV